jgi:FdhE protein
MTTNQGLSADQIQTAVETIKRNRPAYGSLLDFYGQVFSAQEESKNSVQLDPVLIADEVLSAKRQERLPLIDLAEFKIDITPAAELFHKLCRISEKADSEMVSSVLTIGEALNSNQLDLETLFKAILEVDDAFFETTAKRIGVAGQALAFLTYSSINPCIVMCAEQLSTYLKTDTPWKEGYCPVCGCLPAVSALEDEGGRFLFCSFCWHRWQAPRVRCPFCGNADNQKLHYFFDEKEKEYRVDVCDSCNKYIKTVDTRKIDRPLYPPLEQVSTLHLDIIAREKGLESGSHLPIDV